MRQHQKKGLSHFSPGRGHFLLLSTNILPQSQFHPPSLQATMASAPTSTGSAKVDAVVQKAAAAVPGTPTGFDLYARFALAGAIGCSVTHGALTPVDVVKTRIQLDPATYNRGMIGSFKQVIQNEGPLALLTGFGPTFAGYFLQGSLKFGGYEFFKQQSINLLGYETASNNRTAVYLASAAAGEFFADIALCPLEATRIRLVSEPTYANGLIGGFTKMAKQEGLGAFYAGFGPILFKQIPYTMAKFVVYEKVAEAIFRAYPKETLSSGQQTQVNLASGLIAGLAAAVVSQPADTMLSKINKTKGAPGQGTVSRLIQIAGELGVRGSFAGLPTRLFMVGTLTAGQFALYGDIKAALGATGAVEIAK
ncbi:Mitochondrial phosphate carrier protein 1 [Verticillium dahliae]